MQPLTPALGVAMTEYRPRRRGGLEGLPVNSEEVWVFDAVRRSVAGGGDLRTLVICWLAVVGCGWLAMAGRSVGLAAMFGLGLVLVGGWTWTKLRSRAAARRLMRGAGALPTLEH